MLGWLKPQDKIEQSQQDSGLRQLMYDGALSQTMGVFTGGAFLVAFALLLGASNLVIGLFAAIGPFTQILQIPAVWLVDRTRLRKALVVFSSLASRSFWLIVAVIPWLLPAPLRVPVFVGCLVAFFGLGAISGCAFNSWMRDLIPEQIMGRYFSRRMAVSMALGAVLSMAAAFGVDYASAAWDAELGAYSVLFALGAVAGLAGVFFLMRVPEPKMVPPEEKRSLLASLVRPFRDTNFRRLLHFLAAWNFAANLAGPFFVVFMLRRIGLPMTWIIGLSVLSQLINVAFLRIWGKLADRYTNKSVLAVSGPLFMLSVLLWVFTTLPDRHVLTIPLLIGIHALSGMSTAGVGLCAGNIAMRLAPKGEATSYLAINALVSGLAATVAPILGGLAADFFQTRELAIDMAWVSSARRFTLPVINLRGLDFLFIGAFLVGLYAIHRLVAVNEVGQVDEQVVYSELYAEVRKSVRHVSNVAGLRQMTYFPYVAVRKIAGTVTGLTNNVLGRNVPEDDD